MTPCNEAQINDYIDGLLTSKERINIEQHLSECEACRQYTDSLNVAQKALLLAAEYRPVPENAAALTHAIMQRVRRENRKVGIEAWLHLLLPRPVSAIEALRFGFGVASIVLLALFAYQQSIISTKLSVLESSLTYTDNSSSKRSSEVVVPHKIASSLLISSVKLQLKKGDLEQNQVKNLIQRIEALELEKSEIILLLESDPELSKAVEQHFNSQKSKTDL